MLLRKSSLRSLFREFLGQFLVIFFTRWFTRKSIQVRFKSIGVKQESEGIGACTEQGISFSFTGYGYASPNAPATPALSRYVVYKEMSQHKDNFPVFNNEMLIFLSTWPQDTCFRMEFLLSRTVPGIQLYTVSSFHSEAV